MAYKRPIKPFTPEQLAARRAALPHISYPEELPVSARREDIMRAIKYSQVVIVAGETGSGKTTQLPKMCLELGLGVEGLIGHTQPRRIAARSVAERISAELGVELGGAIGYQVRFTDRVSDNTLVKLMTDGILLAEIQSDPLLRHYSAIIIDEAHERSLNIDFLLGYLARLLPRRPDLKLIITSATIDSERFSAHFGEHMYGGFPGNRAPIVEVSGRTYPVEIRYRPLWNGDMGGTRGDGAGRSSRNTGNARGDGGALSARSSAVALYTGDEEGSARPTANDQTSGIIDATEELIAEGPGDILVFLSGEGEIHETQKALKDELGERYIEPGGRSAMPGAIEVLPLYARLSSNEQHRIFQPHQHRRIVLATNIAETSLTVPGIRYVIDPGTARISRYSNKTKVQRLPIENISQASANQRSGRCGRVQDGIAIRLYSEEDFASRPEYTEPEIQRTSLASVILQMAALGLGAVENFPFIDPPDMKAVRAGVQLLQEIGALTAGGKQEISAPTLTKMGRQLARLPIDPRLGRMLLAGADNGCAAEMIVLVAAMSVQDVRERPEEERAQADQLHARFTDPSSDFLAYLNMWRYLSTQQRELSGSAFRRLCRAEYINWLRWREWQDVAAQLRQLSRPLKLNLHPLALPSSSQIRAVESTMEEKGEDISHHRSVVKAVKKVGAGSDAPAANALHRSLLSGLLSNLGSWDEKKRSYEGARGTHFLIWPGSGLHRKRYAWVMAAELVETSHLFARSVARIEPEWVEPLAQHLVKRSYSEPFWSIKRGAAMVHEKVTLYGLAIIPDRLILASSLGTAQARELAREIFIRSALVNGEWRSFHDFVQHNQAQLEQAREVETRLRHYGLIADEDAQYAFFDARIPENIVSARHFDRWWKNERRRNPHLLDFTQEFLLGESQEAAGTSDFPNEWYQGDIKLPITYSFQPGGHADGVSVDIPVTLLPQLRDEGFDWLVPGMLPELVLATIRALPKRVRRNLVPAPDVAREILSMIQPDNDGIHNVQHTCSFHDAFCNAVAQLRGIDIDDAAWEEAYAALPGHLHITFIVRSERGAVLDEGSNLTSLKMSLAPQSRSAVQSVMAGAVSQALDEAQLQLLARQKQAAAATQAAHSPSPAASLSSSPIDDLHTWPELPNGEIPATIETPSPHGGAIYAYPALVETPGNASTAAPPSPTAATTVALRVLTTQAEQRRDHERGVIRLLAGELALSESRISTRWNSREALVLSSSPYPTTGALIADLQLAATRIVARQWARSNKQPLGTLRTRTLYEDLRSYARERTENETYRIAQIVVKILEAWADVQSSLRAHQQVSLIATTQDVRKGADSLVYPGFIAATPDEYLPDIPRFLHAGVHRIAKAESSPHQDEERAWQVEDMHELLERKREQAAREPYDPQRAAILTQARWLIEELKVSLFAQQLGTRTKVSEQRIRKLLSKISS